MLFCGYNTSLWMPICTSNWLCVVHYKGRVIQSGEIFMDSVSESESKEPVKVVAGRGMKSDNVILLLE